MYHFLLVGYFFLLLCFFYPNIWVKSLSPPPPLTTPIHNTGFFFSKVRVRAYKALEPYCARQCANIANYPEADPGGGASGGSIEPPF